MCLFQPISIIIIIAGGAKVLFLALKLITIVVWYVQILFSN